jgi:hypothetical protein
LRSKTGFITKIEETGIDIEDRIEITIEIEIEDGE